MATLKTRSDLATEAETLAVSFEYVYFRGLLYAPVDFETWDDSVIPPIERKSWMPMGRQELCRKARSQFNTLFANEQQMDSFISMVVQSAQHPSSTMIESALMVKTKQGLRVLREDGKLYDPEGSFIPNCLRPLLNEDAATKAEVADTITSWVGGEAEEAASLLRHLATALAPHWSAGKYVLLIGNGRNGKSVLMKMLTALFGRDNCSGITRQDISDKSPALFDLNGKLLNVVYDGQAEYLKDSGTEKSLITGEEVKVRRLYSSTMSPVQTNALFVEGLNQEPKSKDKSSALQARLVRFWFPNKYPVDAAFERKMLSEEYLGAFLSLLIDHYVHEYDVAVMLAPTERSRELQLEHMEENSLALQFVTFLEETEPLGAEAVLVDMTYAELTRRFSSWRIHLNDLSVWDSSAVTNMFRPVLTSERKSQRVDGKEYPVKIRVVTGLTQETKELLAIHKEEADAAVVDD